MSDRFWVWLLIVIGCLNIGIGLATSKHYLVTDGLVLLVLSGISIVLSRLDEIERRLDR